MRPPGEALSSRVHHNTMMTFTKLQKLSALSERRRHQEAKPKPSTTFPWSNYLDLNVTKTKELIIDFRKNCDQPKPNIIHAETVERVDSYKYFLNSFNVSETILCNFYHSFIESI